MRNFFQRKEYRINPDRDEWVAPEETLVDSGSAHSTVEVPVADATFRVFYGVAIVLCLVLLGSVARLTIVRYDFFSLLSFHNRTVNVTVPPPRGIIMDRTGVPLVQNVPSFDLLVISRQVEREATGALRGIPQLARALNRPVEELALEIEDGIRKGAVFFAATDVPRAQVLALAGGMPPGFSVITNTKRQYADGIQFSQLLGYVGKVSKKDMATDPYYLPSDTIGRLGIEAQYEEILRGEHGTMVFDATLQPTSQNATAGGNLVLSVDAAVQKQLFNALYKILQEAGLSEAAAVAQDPRDGSVLGMVSFPFYDNNVFSGGRLSREDYTALFESDSRPLFNRAIGGRYNPGSTIKPFVGMAALEENIMRPNQVVTHDCVSISIPNPTDPSDPYVFKNWRPDTGAFDLNRAIADSCNIYFFTVGGGYGAFNGLGAEKLTDYLKAGFADTLLGIDIPGEEQGFVPTPDWKYQTYKEPWYQGDTYNISIGQGDLLVTPLWINSYISAIAHDGTLWQPRIASRIVDEQRGTLAINEPVQLGKLPFSSSVLRSMQIAMRHTVTEGTGKIFQDLPVSAAAKTGTAEVIKGRRINSLVTVYAPADNPQIVLTVLIEGSASNQGYALRAAHNFLSWYFDSERIVAPRTAIPSASIAPVASSSGQE
jgi:penicillin-binding protein 2